jgi:hypothetical protein
VKPKLTNRGAAVSRVRVRVNSKAPFSLPCTVRLRSS